MDGDGNPSKKFPVSTLLWGMIGAFSCASMIPLEPNLLEEGLILETAQRLTRGEHLYQDVVAFTGPLPFEMLAMLFRIFGEEIWVGRVVVVLLHGGASAAAFAMARRTRSDGLEHIAGAMTAFAPILLFPLFSTYFYTTLAVSLGVLASWAAMQGLRDLRWAFVAGVVVAGSALCKQTIGAVLAAGLLVSMLACASPGSRVRTAAALIGGGVLSAIVTILAFASTGGVGALAYSLIELPLSFQSTYDSPMINFWPPGVFSEELQGRQIFYLPYFFSLQFGVWGNPGWALTALTQLIYALPFVGLIATFVRRGRGPLPAPAWIHLATLVAMSSNLFPRSDWGHLVAVLPSAAVQLVLIAPIVEDSKATRSRVATIVVGFFALLSVGIAGGLYLISEDPNLGPRVPLRAVNEGLRGQSMPRVVRYLREHTEPGDEIFVARAEPLIYFATDTRNPTPYGGVIQGMQEEQQNVIIEALETTRYVVMSDIDQPIFTYYRDALPRVQQTLERYYRIPDDFIGDGSSWIQVLERGPDRGETHTDLINELPRGRPWVHVRNGTLKWAKLYPGIVATAQNRRFLPFLVGANGGGVDFDVTIPESAIFQASIGISDASSSERIHQHPPASRMIVSIREQDKSRIIALADVNPREGDVRRWKPIEADLAKYAGRRVTLRLELLTSWKINGFRLAWWGSPRIAIRPASDDSG